MTQEHQSASLSERISQRITADGPLTFAEFMRACLYDPERGFFAGLPVGEGGDFVTSPHVSPVFGRLLARQVEDFWELLGRPDPFAVVEVGAGDGTLAAQVLDSLPARMRHVGYLAVEQSAAGREALGRLGISVAASLDEVEPVERGCVLANEVIDNFPFHRVLATEAGLAELYVGLADERLTLVPGPASSEEIERLAPSLQPGQEGVVCTEALRFLDAAVALLGRGHVWIADYAATEGDPAAQVHGYRRHRVEPDVLEDPGSRDITAGVDLGALVRHAKDLGLFVFGPVTQRNALMALGFRDLALQARSRQVEALQAGRGLDALRAYSDRNRADLLVDPTGLGRFAWLCLGVGVDRPPRSMRPPG